MKFFDGLALQMRMVGEAARISGEHRRTINVSVELVDGQAVISRRCKSDHQRCADERSACYDVAIRDQTMPPGRCAAVRGRDR